ncbi:MAG: ArsR/SmtB family transcription factor [Anaerolineales bacterium]|jgi:DNA-binding transcriptional ArsR family regulator
MADTTEQKTEQITPTLIWEVGTAFDLMMSLEVIHNPENFGLRPSWAAGVRSRVPSSERGVLEDSLKIIYVPLAWLHTIPEPKDGEAVLWALRQIPPEERLIKLSHHDKMESEYAQILSRVYERRSWDEDDQENLQQVLKGKKGITKKDIHTILGWWSRPEEFGDLYLRALQSYYQEFFAEEEQRIKPALQKANAQAQELSQSEDISDLIEILSQGVKILIEPEITEIVFAPSYWITPLILYDSFAPQQKIFLYGARPADASLVPGEVVPDALLRGLKALAEPTRLKIIRYLAQEPLSPAQLSRRLRLRPPTVIHHLEVLRLAGLVRLNLEVPGERNYAARLEGLEDTFNNITEFLQAGKSD